MPSPRLRRVDTPLEIVMTSYSDDFLLPSLMVARPPTPRGPQDNLEGHQLKFFDTLYIKNHVDASCHEKYV